MKMNGVIIMRISDFKRFFDFQEFWSQKQEFINLFKQKGYVDFFCSLEEEKIWCKYVLGWLSRSLESIYDYREHKEKYDDDTRNKKQILRIEDVLKKQNQSELTIMGLVSLFMLVSDTLCTDEIERWLKIMRGNGLESNYYEIYESKEFTQTDNPKYPLFAKPIVNKSGSLIKITVGKESKELSSEGHKGSCIVGLFDADGKCYRLLPNIGNNGRMEFRIRFNDKAKRTYLEMEDNLTKTTQKVQDVVSFYLNQKGYIYIPYGCQGAEDLLEKSSLYIPDLFELDKSINILAVNEVEGRYEFITTNG